MKKKTTDKTFEESINITEFPLAVSIMCLGYQLGGIEPNKNDSQRLEFIFEKNEATERIIAGYWNGNLLVEPKQFWNITRELKSRIRNAK